MKTKTYELFIYGMLAVVVGLFVMLQTGCGQGPQGPAGVNGQSCNAKAVSAQLGLPNGGVSITCPDSQTLLANGSNGTPGTLITPIQFCPGTISYPSTFPEVGFCINQTLYAVYSANDGFLTALPEGAYNSNAIGSTCSFTVTPNCGILP